MRWLTRLISWSRAKGCTPRWRPPKRRSSRHLLPSALAPAPYPSGRFPTPHHSLKSLSHIRTFRSHYTSQSASPPSFIPNPLPSSFLSPPLLIPFPSPPLPSIPSLPFRPAQSHYTSHSPSITLPPIPSLPRLLPFSAPFSLLAPCTRPRVPLPFLPLLASAPLLRSPIPSLSYSLRFPRLPRPSLPVNFPPFPSPPSPLHDQLSPTCLRSGYKRRMRADSLWSRGKRLRANDLKQPSRGRSCYTTSRSSPVAPTPPACFSCSWWSSSPPPPLPLHPACPPTPRIPLHPTPMKPTRRRSGASG